MNKINIKILLFIAGILTFGHPNLKAQDDLKITIDIKTSKIKIDDLLKEIEQQTGYSFSYASSVGMGYF